MPLMDFFSKDSPEKIGQEVLMAYFNEAKNYSEFLTKNYKDFISSVNKKVPNFEGLVGELVQKNYASTSKAQAMSRLAMLANKSAGRATLPQIVQAAGGSGDTVNYVAAIPSVAKEGLKDVGRGAVAVGEGVKAVGQGVVSTLKLGGYLPVILLGFGAIVVYAYSSQSKRVLGLK